MEASMTDWPEQTAESLRIWNNIAACWDAYMGDAGNDFHTQLVEPAADHLVQPGPGQRILELGCGAGLYARRLAQAGASVVATDGSIAFLDIARRRSQAHGVELAELNVSSAAHWSALQQRQRPFDAVVANMMLMDVACITTLFRNVFDVLRPGGIWVMTLMHPCFNSADITLVAEQKETVRRNVLQVNGYMDVEPYKGYGIAVQPEPHIYFHRPLHVIFNALFACGFTVDGLEERAFAPKPGPLEPLNFGSMPQIPPLMAIRARKPVGAGHRTSLDHRGGRFADPHTENPKETP